ncbi:MAG: GNAT family N-acetyltransferase [Nocardioides sp.]|nr:GNAT family N-acetyltransferase [Nocardioides sp.]
MSYEAITPSSTHVVEKAPANSRYWHVSRIDQRASDKWRFIAGSNGTSHYLLRMEDGAMVARTYKVVPVESSWGNREVRVGKNFTLADDDLPENEHVIVVGSRVGYLTWFPGAPEYTGSNIDGGVIHKTYVSRQHRSKGVATAMLDFARDTFPGKDVRHSNALTPDGAAFAAATPTPNDLPRRTTTAA